MNFDWLEPRMTQEQFRVRGEKSSLWHFGVEMLFDALLLTTY